MSRIEIGRALGFDDIYPVGTILTRDDDISPAQLFGGSWEKQDGYFGTPTIIQEGTDYRDFPPYQEELVMSITIPPNSVAFISGMVSANVPDSNSIVLAKLTGAGQEVDARTTMSSGGGVASTLVVKSNDRPENIALRTYNYRDVNTPLRGFMQAIVLQLKSIWRRTA